MTQQIGFLREAWRRMRPNAVAVAVDTGDYVLIWAGIVAAHIVKVMVAAAGIDPDIIQAVSFMEKWTWIASFAAFFWRTLMRIWRSR